MFVAIFHFIPFISVAKPFCRSKGGKEREGGTKSEGQFRSPSSPFSFFAATVLHASNFVGEEDEQQSGAGTVLLNIR